MYNTFSEAVNGFSKNVIMFFGDSFVLAVLFWLLTTFGFVAIFHTFSFPVFIGYLLILLFIRVLISIASQQNIFKNLIALIPQQMALGLFIYKAFINTFHKQFEWKGRNIS
jgi:hypothetical protein